MSRLILYILCVVGFCYSCSQTNTVTISGRIENGDSIINIWVEDSVYKFELDEDFHFNGVISLKESGYATLLNNSLNLYLVPGQELEIYGDAQNFVSSLYFRGSLASINRYLKEQEVSVFFDREFYNLEEDDFVRKMKELVEEKQQLLKAKNFDDAFTQLEMERISYMVAEQFSLYPLYQIRVKQNLSYAPGEAYRTFLASFSLNNERLLKSLEYRRFLINYLNVQAIDGDYMNRTNRMANYILSRITNQSVRDFLLTELVIQHIHENNGLNNADYILKVFRQECKDEKLRNYTEDLLKQWEKLLPGNPAPDFCVKDREGRDIKLEDFKGSYLYIDVWATWCIPCKNELPYLDLLEEEYKSKNIKFLTVSIDLESNKKQWEAFLDKYNYKGTHGIVDAYSQFTQQFKIISVPRFILIGPDGSIINSNAPRPSGTIRDVFNTLNI
ncbi:MAG: TlpA family protein disulfide reductase [Marinifilaceae bacterium]